MTYEYRKKKKKRLRSICYILRDSARHWGFSGEQVPCKVHDEETETAIEMILISLW